MRQAMERMEFHRYSAVPLIDHEGKYAGTITEGDLLWKMKNTPGLSFANTHKTSLLEVEQQQQNASVLVDAQIEDLLSRAAEQNFIPVVDDQGIFIGIVRRREIIEHFAQMILNNNQANVLKPLSIGQGVNR